MNSRGVEGVRGGGTAASPGTGDAPLRPAFMDRFERAAFLAEHADAIASAVEAAPPAPAEAIALLEHLRCPLPRRAGERAA